jgi:hypothetical protein
MLALSLLLAAACSRFSPPHSCPMYQVADGVTVNASMFFAAHATAHELCVAGTRCVVRLPGEAQVSTLVLTGTSTALTIEITVLARDGTALLGKSVRVTLHRVVFNAACGISALRGTVTITAQGALTVG